MRILHFADLHIGVENYSRVDPETGLSTRLQDFLNTYDELVDYAIETSVDLVLFCGDAYKSRDPSQTHQREFAKRIAKLSLDEGGGGRGGYARNGPKVTVAGIRGLVGVLLLVVGVALATGLA